jgi:hypothetical protein
MPNSAAMVHPIRLQGMEEGFATHRTGNVAHQPCPQTRLMCRDLTVILIASVIKSKHRGGLARLTQ